ncbi:MAG: ATP-dependent DNA helicase [Roseovarius sp.]
MQIELTSEQSKAVEAVRSFLMDDAADVFVLAGSAGTGKTTMIARLVEVAAEMKLSCALAAPTGRAARILGDKVAQATGWEAQAKTIHSLIYALDRLEVNEEAEATNDPGLRWFFPLAEDEPAMSILIVDEASMVGDREVRGDVIRFGSGRLLKDLVAFVRSRRREGSEDRLVKLLFVGDLAQLPPVGEEESPALSPQRLGAEFGLTVSTFQLETVMRQREGSAILERATEIRKAIAADVFNAFSLEPDGEEIVRIESEVAFDVLERSVRSRGSSVVVVRSNAAALEYNRGIRERLWGDASRPVQVGDILLVNRNAHLVSLRNGDLVKVLDVTPAAERASVPVQGGGTVELSFRDATVAYREADGTVVRLPCKILENLLDSPGRELTPLEQRALLVHFRQRNPQLKPKSREFAKNLRADPYFNAVQVKFGYAMTCHKAQGGEWDEVLVDFADVGGVRNRAFFRWAYTALTRAKRRLYVVEPPDFDVISADMWGETDVANELACADETEAAKLDPDWDRFSFSSATARLLPRHRQLRERWSALGIDVASLKHLEYCERYTLVRDGVTAELQYYYNGKNRLRRFGPTPGTRSHERLLAEALSAFDGLGDTGNRENRDEFVADFLKRLDASLDGAGIRRTSFKLMPYRLRVSFADGSRSGDIDFTYDSSKTWTAAQEVGGPGASGGLYSEVQRFMKQLKS